MQSAQSHKIKVALTSALSILGSLIAVSTVRAGDAPRKLPEPGVYRGTDGDGDTCTLKIRSTITDGPTMENLPGYQEFVLTGDEPPAYVLNVQVSFTSDPLLILGYESIEAHSAGDRETDPAHLSPQTPRYRIRGTIGQMSLWGKQVQILLNADKVPASFEYTRVRGVFLKQLSCTGLVREG